ncbi:MAG: adaptor protein MecA [Lachnospiraceae bacterium]|nr:adaptor protein MecA [Lachnospiraceae bacterium]
MRIEKISDKQIRCTLSRDDLSTRHLNIAELAYGSEKARSLFREMLTKASKDFGFQADNMPLMIEAVPLSEESIMLLITKVEDPEELDTRFARFSPGDSDDTLLRDDDSFSMQEEEPAGADTILEEFTRLCQETLSLLEEAGQEVTEAPEPDFYQVFQFSSLDTVCKAAKVLCGAYDDVNSLYKDPGTLKYYLVVHKGDHSVETFNKICNILSEYGEHQKSNAATAAYFEEHLDVILADHAIQSLESL